MPTDLELISSFVNLSADAREVLLKLNEFVAQNKTVTWQLSGGVNVSADSLPKMIAGFIAEKSAMFLDFEKNFGGVYSSTIARGSDGISVGGTVTYMSGHVLEMTYTRTAGALSAIVWALKDGATVLAAGAKTITRNASGQIVSIA